MNTLEDIELNVTELEPRFKHSTIFARFDELVDGQSLTIHNDHDPKPLYYQLLGERGEIFVWNYLENGPEWWRIKITKKLTGEADETLGEIAAKDLRKAQVFKKYGLDFCCQGKRTVKEACEEKGIDVKKVEQELQQTDKLATAARPLPYGDWSLDFLADYIVNTHHTYVRNNIPDLKTYADKVNRVHGDRHPELDRVNELVIMVANELTDHMAKEEGTLFPFVKKVVIAKTSGQPLEKASFGTIENPIHMMEHEHLLVGNAMEEIRHITDNYTLPQDSCASYKLLFKMLEEFEDDLHLHIHLENNILFPKVIEMEKTLRK